MGTRRSETRPVVPRARFNTPWRPKGKRDLSIFTPYPVRKPLHEQERVAKGQRTQRGRASPCRGLHPCAHLCVVELIYT